VSDFTLDELCVVACADAWRGDGEILASPIGVIPALAARLAQLTFAPDLFLADAGEGPIPFRSVFDLVWSGRRHVMMGAAQLDRHGNQNISCIGPHARPRAQLLGARGAPGNTINHATSYWLPAHTPRVLVERVDAVCGIGADRAAALGTGGRFHELRRVVTSRAVLDLGGPGGTLRVVSLHPGVTLGALQAQTGFPLAVSADLAETRAPTAEELRLLREVLDPRGARRAEVKA
jgi:hypothetical protein